MPRFSIAAAAAGMAQYLQQSQQQHQNSQLKGHGASIVDRPHLYWPGLQGLVANPMAWRDRLTGTSKYYHFTVAKYIVMMRFIGHLIVVGRRMMVMTESSTEMTGNFALNSVIVVIIIMTKCCEMSRRWGMLLIAEKTSCCLCSLIFR